MKRDIKFKVFSTASKRMNGPYFLGANMGINSDSMIMQYTGLKDKNGKEIYEGDILKLHEDWRGKGEIPGYVVFENGRWILQGTMHYSHKDDLTNYALSQMEIIGNIFQHPELLQP